MLSAIRPLSSDEWARLHQSPVSVVAFVIGPPDDCSDDRSGPVPMVPVAELRMAVDDAPDDALLVFLHAGSLADQRALAGSIVAQFDPLSDSVAIPSVPAREAIKRVDGTRVIEAVDRSTVFLHCGPEVMTRQALIDALDILDITDVDQPVNPAVVVARSGRTVRLVESSSAM
ncbi:MAG: 2-C-methyl-D-erythritol 4-phosphate cytidylyltransferase [Acidimicrobiia bacterium]|nr:2-C-methyl-D-erythritol 4-phosphate cytidylyltransferase [Acidimicrobiia bacterium]